MEGLHVDHAGDGREQVHHQEVAEILPQHDRIERELRGTTSAAGEEQHGHADHHHGEGGEHQRRAEDGAGADLLSGAMTAEDGHQRQ